MSEDMNLTALTLEQGKAFKPQLDAAIRFTMAAVDPQSKTKGWTTIYVTLGEGDDKSTVILCSLHTDKVPQQVLDFTIEPLDNIELQIAGAAEHMYLTGSILGEEEDDDDMYGDDMYDEDMYEEGEQNGILEDDGDDESESESEDEPPKIEELDEDEDEDEDDCSKCCGEEERKANIPGRSLTKQEGKNQQGARQHNTQETKTQKKKGHTDIKTPSKTPEGTSANKTPAKTPDTKQSTGTGAKMPTKTPEKKVLAGGLTAQDYVIGKGKTAKKGSKIFAYYQGRLHNGKIFDSQTTGKGFSFRVGAGEVIKGWDVGFEGMKVGGKRRLIVPPKFAYGKSGAPPDIPKNATLTFDVELVNIK